MRNDNTYKVTADLYYTIKFYLWGHKMIVFYFSLTPYNVQKYNWKNAVNYL